MPKRIDVSISVGDSFSFKKLEQPGCLGFLGEYTPGCLGFLGEYTAHLCGDYNKPL